MTAPSLATRGSWPSRSEYAGTVTLLRFLLRRDRVKLPAWAGGHGLFMLYLATALPTVYEFEEDLAGAAELFQQPVGRLMIGPGYGFEDPSLERFITNGYGLYFLLLAALMNILLVTRHTRLEEQTGRAELIRASVVGPRAPLAAAVVVAVATNVAAALLVLVVMLGVRGYGASSSVLFVAGIAVTGLAFAGLTLLTAQLTRYSRAAAGLAGVGLGAAFVVRAGGDIAQQGGSTLSWFSPLAWGQQTAPFVLDRWWPLALPFAFAVVTALVGAALVTRRDLGAGMLADRSGRPDAVAALGTPLGLARRLQRASILGWSGALAAGGVAFGAYADALVTALDDMPDVFVDLFGGPEDVLDGYLAYMAVFFAYMVSIYAVLAVRGLRGEETGGRGEPVLATPVSRWTWLSANLAVTFGGVVVLMLVAGVATGVGAAAVTSDLGHVGEMTLAHLAQVPPVLVVLGLAVLLFGVWPRWIAVGYGVVGYGIVLGSFGPLLDLPTLVLDLSPFEHAAEPPLEAVAATPLVLLTLVGVVMAAAGMLAFRRRDLDLT